MDSNSFSEFVRMQHGINKAMQDQLSELVKACKTLSEMLLITKEQIKILYDLYELKKDK